MQIKTIIIDDEGKGRNLLNELLKRYCPKVEVMAMAADAKAGIVSIKQLHPDCILLDIQMPGMDGFAMLDELDTVDCEIIFVTAHNEFAIKAFKYAAFDYILKPVDPQDLVDVFDRLEQKLKQPKNNQQIELLKQIIHQPKQLPAKLTISTSDGINLINIADIIYMKADGPYTHFYLQNGEKIMASVNLQKYEELLTEQNFFRTHHSYLVNLQQIKKFNKADSQVLLSTGHLVDVSKRRKEEFLQALARL